MKQDGKYRFTLQFPADSEEQIRVGEMLEKLGNRKSAVIVMAMNEYLEKHPQLQEANQKIQIKFHSGYNRAEIEKLVQTIVEEKLAASSITISQDSALLPQTNTNELEADVTQMLDNLDLFM